LAPPGTLRFDVPTSRSAQRNVALHVRALPAGTSIALVSSGLGARRRCRRLAREAGVELLREFIAVPSVDPPTCYVEESPAALRYFFTQLLALPRGGAAKSAGLAAINRIARVFVPAGLVGSAAPVRIVVGRISNRVVASSLLELRGIRMLVVALSKDPNAKVTVLLIPIGSDQPSLAIKIPTTAPAEATIAAEHSVLLDLHARLRSDVLASIPALKELPEAQGRPWLVTTALPGVPMTTRYHAWRHVSNPAAVDADFRAAEVWLAKFQSASAGPRSPLDMDGGTTELLRRRFAGDPLLDQRLARLNDIHNRLRSTTTPRTGVHGDFWFGNVLMAGKQISGVIDWEGGVASGEPVRDLVRFALSYSLYLDRHTRPGHRVAGHRGLRAGEWGAGITWSFEGEGWFPELVRGFIRGGLERLGADPGCWREALLAGLAEVAATADHLDFAATHWELFDRLAQRLTSSAAGPRQARS
jgi:phosphotransferase family enzyme